MREFVYPLSFAFLTLVRVACASLEAAPIVEPTSSPVPTPTERPYLERVRDFYPTIMRDKQLRGWLDEAHNNGQGIIFFHLNNLTNQNVRLAFMRIDIAPSDLQVA